jgi:hypothetical protein
MPGHVAGDGLTLGRRLASGPDGPEFPYSPNQLKGMIANQAAKEKF